MINPMIVYFILIGFLLSLQNCWGQSIAKPPTDLNADNVCEPAISCPCYLDNLQLKKLVKSSEIVVVDSRQSTDFNRSHIANALNLPLFSIPTKEYLKNSPLILTGAPYEVRKLVSTCQSLLSSGFKSVKSLPNGMLRWQAAGGEIVGNSIDLRRTHLVTSQQILSELINGDWHIIDLSKGQAQPLQISNIKVTSAAFSSSPEVLIKTLRTHLINFKENPEDLWVALITETTDTKEEEILLTAAQKLSDLGNVFVINGGRNGLNDLISRDEKVRLQLNESKKIKQCGR